MTKIQIDRRLAESLIKATFPEYNGRKVCVVVCDRVQISDLNWSGGSRSQYRSCTLDGRATGSADAHNQSPPWNNQVEGSQVALEANHAIVEHSIFCGKDMGLTIYVRPDGLPRGTLPAECELTDLERAALHIIGGIKSGYRADEFRRSGLGLYGKDNPHVVRLAARGLLKVTSTGVQITMEGRNQR